ncbi:MAG: penicillin-binding protein 1C [Pseudomonadota bacterium]
MLRALHITRRQWIKAAKISAASVAFAFVVFLAFKPPLLDTVSFSHAVFDRHGALLRLTLSRDEKYRLFVPLNDIAPHLREGVLLHEDQYFYRHAGVNPVALGRAFVQSYLLRNRKIGASTITMQLARIQYGINSHRITGKLWQIARAVQLDLHYSKDALLEAYLNLVPYGYNVEGVGAASFIYLHKKPIDLTLPESLTLAVIPQNPNKRRPEHANPAKPALIQARNRLFERWLETHPESADQKPFFTLPLATYGVENLPFRAPHLVVNLLAKYKTIGQIHSTVDLDMQTMLENILRRYVTDRRDIGINNASALLVDTQTMQVIASIGSADFFNKPISGQVDGTNAKRSPGSALKPFVYALAFDQGLIHPMSVLGDAPTNFGSYSPDNFDRDFRGPIPAHDALRLSRNVPAITLASQLKAPDLYQFFTQAGIAKLRTKDDYGLSLVLGAAEVTMRELAGLYAMLANDGMLQPLVFRMDDTQTPKREPLLTGEASFMTLDALRDTPRPYSVSEAHRVYWKTGTSNGYRDAWTAGVFGHYVLVVWVGNFNGKNNPALVGVRTAAPLFFAMVDAIDEKEPHPERIASKPNHLRLRKLDVCATTGDLSSEGCPALASTWFIPGVSPIHRHDVYRKILVNIATGKRACHFEPGLTEYRTFEVWPSDLRQTLQKAGIRKPSLPPREQNCDNTTAPSSGRAPVITSPQASVEYHARLTDSASEAIPLNATADGDATSLHWFIDNDYFGKSVPGESLSWHPKPGRYQVRVVDEHGRSAATTMLVSLAQ